MTTAGFSDISDRYQLANELHARPFPSISDEGHAVCIAFRLPDASPETRSAEHDQLIDSRSTFFRQFGCVPGELEAGLFGSGCNSHYGAYSQE